MKTKVTREEYYAHFKKKDAYCKCIAAFPCPAFEWRLKVSDKLLAYSHDTPEGSEYFIYKD